MRVSCVRMQAVCVCRFVSGNDTDEGRVRSFPPLSPSACWPSLTSVDVGMSRRAAKVGLGINALTLLHPFVRVAAPTQHQAPAAVEEASPQCQSVPSAWVNRAPMQCVSEVWNEGFRQTFGSGAVFTYQNGIACVRPSDL